MGNDLSQKVGAWGDPTLLESIFQGVKYKKYVGITLTISVVMELDQKEWKRFLCVDVDNKSCWFWGRIEKEYGGM